MVWRTLGRIIAVAVPGGALLVGWLVYQSLNGAAVRAMVVANLRERFVGADVSLGAANFRLLGGITFDNLTLFRRDDKSQTPILHVPAGVIYHDKEQLARGKLAIRKIKFERPRLTATRSADGRWNVDGILGPVHPDVPIPVMEIDQGAVTVELAAEGKTPAVRVEVRGVQATLLNTPITTLNFEGRGDAGPFGRLAVQGHWHRISKRVNASLELDPIPLGPALLRELTRFAPATLEPVERLTGNARIHVELAYLPDAAERWRHQARVEVHGGGIVHRALPFPVERLDLSGRWDDGRVVVEKLTAQAGGSPVSGRIEFQPTGAATVVAAMSAPGGEPGRLPASLDPTERAKDILQAAFAASAARKAPPTTMTAMLSAVKSLELSVGKLPVGPELFARLPPSFQRINTRFAPVGPLDVTWTLDRQGEAWSAGVRVRTAGVSGRYDDFPYPLTNVRGRVDWSSAHDKSERLELDLTGDAPGGKPVTVVGWVDGDGPDPWYSYDITADGLVIDETLVKSLPPRFQTAARTFHPAGQCDVALAIRHARGEGPARQHYSVRFRDSSLRYEPFPYPLDHLTGTLDVRLGPGPAGDPQSNNVFTFDGFRGRRNGGDVTFRGTARPSAHGTRINLDLTGERVPLDGEMAAAFARMKLHNVWELFGPSGRMNFAASVAHRERPDGPPEFDIRVTPTGATVRPTFFPYTMSGVTGSFRLTRGRVELGEFRARHGPTEWRFAGGQVLMPEGGYWAKVGGLEAAPLPLDADFLRALPQAIRTACQALQPKGALALNVRELIVDAPPPIPGPPSPPLIYWDGQIGFNGAAMKAGVEVTDMGGVVACRGRYRGQIVEGVEGHLALGRALVLNQPVENLHADLIVRPDAPQVLQLPNIGAALYGGRVGGEARVEFGAGLKYQLDMKVMDIDLAEFARRNKVGNAQVSGRVRADLYLTGTGAGTADLDGGGSVHIPRGKLYNLPLVLDVLKLPNLHAPDGTAFEEAHADFRINGGRVEVTQLDLIGNLVTLGGRGELNLDGTNADLDLYAVWGHIVQVLPPGLRELPPWLSKNLLRIRARGKLGGQLDFATEPVPGITQPVKRLLDAARGRQTPAGTGR